MGVAPEARMGVAPEARMGVAPEARMGVAPEARMGVAPEARMADRSTGPGSCQGRSCAGLPPRQAPGVRDARASAPQGAGVVSDPWQA